MAYEKSGKGYGKRPMWQWVLIYLIVGGLVYFALYYFVLAKKDGSTPTETTNTNTNTNTGPGY